LNRMAFWIVLLAAIAFLSPNTLEMLGPSEPALGWKSDPDAHTTVARKVMTWDASLAWAVVVSVVASVGILHLTEQSEFLYWQF
jgi:alginate O-acetyltransferase complex protein AlgI